VLGLAAVLLLVTGAQAQKEDRADSAAKKVVGATQKADDKPQADKTGGNASSAELVKARAEVKRLEGQMRKLHEQMEATAEQLHKAYRTMARHHRDDEGWAGMWWGPHPRHAWHHAGMYGRRWRHPGNWFVTEQGPEEGGSSADLSRRLDKLQREVEQLRQELRSKK
jgi:hypothetical protein